MCLYSILNVHVEKRLGISFHPILFFVKQMCMKTDGTRLIHSLNKRRIYNTQIFFQEGNLLFSHPLNCSLLKREVFVQFYFSQCCVMRLPQMIYNQFLWVMFPQWEWFGNEQVTMYWARLSLCPIGHLLLISNQKEFTQGLFQVYELLVSFQISSANAPEVCALSKGGIPVLTWQLVALWLPYFFF